MAFAQQHFLPIGKLSDWLINCIAVEPLTARGSTNNESMFLFFSFGIYFFFFFVTRRDILPVLNSINLLVSTAFMSVSILFDSFKGDKKERKPTQHNAKPTKKTNPLKINCLFLLCAKNERLFNRIRRYERIEWDFMTQINRDVKIISMNFKWHQLLSGFRWNERAWSRQIVSHLMCIAKINAHFAKCPEIEIKFKFKMEMSAKLYEKKTLNFTELKNKNRTELELKCPKNQWNWKFKYWYGAFRLCPTHKMIKIKKQVKQMIANCFTVSKKLNRVRHFILWESHATSKQQNTEQMGFKCVLDVLQKSTRKILSHATTTTTKKEPFRCKWAELKPKL